MRQTGFVHPKRAAALADFYDLSADIVRRSDSPAFPTQDQPIRLRADRKRPCIATCHATLKYLQAA